MASVKDLLIKLRVIGTKQADTNIKKVDKSMVSLGKAAMKTGAAFFAARAIINALQESVKQAEEFTLAVAKMEGVMKSMNRFTPQASKNLQNYADSLQDVTKFSNTAILEGITFLQTYKQIGDEVMPRAVDLMTDLAELMGGDMRTAANMVGKAAMGLSGELRRVGITVDEDIAKSGDFVAILGAIEEQVGGVAKAAGETLAGSLAQARHSVDDLQREIGLLFAPSIDNAARKVEAFAKSLRELLHPETKDTIKLREEIALIQASLDKRLKGPRPESATVELLQKQLKLLQDQLQTRKEAEDKIIVAQLLQSEAAKAAQEHKEAMEKTANFAAATGASLLTSAIAGDSITESLKRAAIQLAIMVTQAKIYNALMKPGGILSGGGIFATIGSFLFGASPTRVAPTANAASSSKIIINQNFGGMGVIDHNFAANSIIPAINKAINTGQARIG